MKKFTFLFALVLFGFSSFGQHTLTLEDAVLNGRKYYPQGLIMPQWVPGYGCLFTSDRRLPNHGHH